jgi:peptidyl-prolyl cis-trans isomerase D
MSSPLRKKRANSVIWVLLGLMLLGLGGYGVTSFSSSASEIGHVGDRKITVNEYANTMRREIQAFSNQIGQPVSFAQAQSMGIDRNVQAQIVAAATLENEAAKLGVSVGDAAVRERIVTASALQGADGKFDRGAYGLFLKQQGLSEAAFEKNLRAEASRTLLQSAVLGGVTAPPALVDRLTAWAAETRSFTFAQIIDADLTAPIPAPDDAQIKAWYDAHNDAYMKPETRKITYVWLAPDDLLDQVEVDEASLKTAYEQRKSEFVVPEKRLVERLALTDIDLGEATKDSLGAAGDAVFALTQPGVVGPIDTDLGPALYAMNGILEAQITTFDEAKPDLRSEVAMDRARRLISDKSEKIQDTLASGASLADVAKETGMKLGTLDYNSESEGGLSGYEAFRKAAEAATPDSFPALAGLDDGGVFALQLDGIDPPVLRPLADVQDKVVADWTADETHKALLALAGEDLAQLENGVTLQGLGLVTTHYDDFARTGYVADASAEIGKQAFEMTAGTSRVIDDQDKVYLLTLDAVTPADMAGAAAKGQHDQIKASLSQSISRDIFEMFTRAAQADVGISLNPQVIAAVNAQMQ